MNNANETRAEFNHLIAVAKDTGCAIVIIAHMNKMRDTNPLTVLTVRLTLRVLQEVFLQSHAHRTRKYLRKDIWCR